MVERKAFQIGRCRAWASRGEINIKGLSRRPTFEDGNVQIDLNVYIRKYISRTAVRRPYAARTTSVRSTGIKYGWMWMGK